MSAKFRERARNWRAALVRPPSKIEWLLLIPCGLLLVGTALVTERMRVAGHVMPQVFLGERDVGGFSGAALEARLQELEAELHERLFRVRVGDAVFRFRGEEIGAGLPDGLVERALTAGRAGNPLLQVSWRLSRFFSPHHIDSRPRYDEARWLEFLAAFERAALDLPSDGGLRFEGAKVHRIEPRKGRSVDVPAATAQLEALLLTAREQVLDVPLVEREPLTTRASVDAVEAVARQLLSGPVRLSIESPEPAETPEQPPSNIERLEPAALAAALAVRVTPGASDLELNFDPDRFEALLAPLRKRWERPSRDARFLIDQRHRITIEPSSIGTRLHTGKVADALLAAGQSETRHASVRLEAAAPPRLTTELAEGLGIRGLVSQFTTSHPCCRPRVHNIHRIADMVDGTVVLPGETFSLNALIGPRSRANGFKPAPTIVHGKMKDTFGGGISQFTTTLFNAVLDAGYEIIERQPHTFYFPRYPVGHEATLSFPKPDFIFKNDTAAGVVLKTEYGSTFIKVKLYGDNEGRKTTRKVSPRFDFVEPPIEYIADDGVLPGNADLKEAGSRGFSVEVTRRIVSSEGQSSEQRRKVIYDPRPRVVAVHSCDIPEGEPAHTGEPCPEPEELDGGAPPAASGEGFLEDP